MITLKEQAMLEIDPALYRRLRAKEMAGFHKDIVIYENDDRQLELVL